MNEAAGTAPPDPAAPVSAGRLLREARERQGLHIAALAALIKVAPKKLEMLEADRFDALPDATFTRALAQTVCRALKIDPAAVMRLLPPPVGHRLVQVAEGLNAPFRDRPSALGQRDWTGFAKRPAFWITALILAAALAVYFLPSGLIRLPSTRAQAASAASITSWAPAEIAGRALETPGMAPEPLSGNEAPLVGAGPFASAPTSASAPALVSPAPDSALVPVGILELRTSAVSWVEVNDARGQPLLSRLMGPGEVLGLDGALPLRLSIGNASATRVTFRGQPTELAAFTRDNVARLELR